MIPNIQTTPLNSKTFKIFALFGLLIFASAETSRWLGVEGLPMSIIWPASGLMLGAGVILGYPIVLFSAAVLAVWLLTLQGASVATALFLATAQALGVVAALMYLRRNAGSQTALQLETRERLVYLRAGALSATVTAGLGAAGMVLAGTELPYSAHDIFLVYWLLEALSILLFAPLAYYFYLNPLHFTDALRRDFSARPMVIWYGAAIALALAVWALPELADRTYAVALSFAFFPLLCWFVLTARAASIMVVIPLFALLYVGFSLFGLGGLPEMETINQTVRSVLFLTGMVLLIQVIAVMNFARNQLLETFKAQANTDFLSGLSNDRAFATAVGQVLESLRQPHPTRIRPSWLVYLQVLDFDHVEDLMGYRASRNLELMLAARLMGTCGPDANPARIGNGIFSLIANDVDKPALMGQLERIYRAYNDEMFSTDGQQTRVRIAIGAVELNGQLDDQSQYLSAATQASLMARDRLPRIQVVQDVAGLMLDRRGMTQRLELLKDALSNDRLVLFAQPIRPIGRDEDELSYEILIRLQDPNGDYLPPGVFLPVAEAYGFMRQIDQWVIRRTLDTLAANPEWLARTRKCSINLAGTSLSTEDILTFIADAFDQTGVPPEKIGFEVTETQHIQSREVAERVTEGLRRLGCSVSLDDFGTGLATFDYLKSFQFDTLKIDGVFIKSIITSEEDRRIVKAMCDVARGMGLKTVAEFVENTDVMTLLQELGVDYGQGFGLGRPGPLGEMFAGSVTLQSAR